MLHCMHHSRPFNGLLGRALTLTAFALVLWPPQPLLAQGPASRASGASRNIILIIADGLGFASLDLLRAYKQLSPECTARPCPSAMEWLLRNGSFRVVSIAIQHTLVTDSACAATALASGSLCLPETLGIDDRGDPVVTIVDRARAQRKSVGVVTDTRITHATPAAFYAHVTHRRKENEIAEMLLKERLDVAFGGGIRHFIPKSLSKKFSGAHPELFGALLGSKRQDSRNLVEEAEEEGFKVALSAGALDRLSATPALGLFASSGLSSTIDGRSSQNESDTLEPTLAQLTQKALHLLEQDSDGFFLMVEVGQIDWALHSNDAGMLLGELLKLDDVLAEVRKWSENRNDTLIVLTADHDTGGFGFSYSSIDVPAPRALPGRAFKAGEFYAPKNNFQTPKKLELLRAQKRSLTSIAAEFTALAEEFRTAEQLQRLVSSSVPFPFPLSAAQKALQMEDASYSAADEESVNHKKWPRIGRSSAYYTTFEDRLTGAIADILADHQGVVWATGTHISAPVPLLVWGPSSGVPAGAFLSTRDVGVFLLEQLGGGRPEYGAGTPR